ncbi:exosome complex component RRP43 [Anabrus simplex]|uniref:exosome complex component RRP43 n=1 Tax=Anabrus simplex TaxID=316456 RepID=UPI0034DD6BE1
MAAEYKTIHPVKYYRDYLAHDVRPDGRAFQKFRPASVNVGSIKTADGSSLVKIGNTTVVCGIKLEIAPPKAEEPGKGFFVPNVTLPPLCSPKFRPGPPSDQAQVASHFVAEVVSNSACIDLGELCIVPEKLVWVLHCDLYCLDHDGALLDACVIALIAALRTVTFPVVEYDADKDTTVVSEKKRKSLTVHSAPVATTFAIFDDDILITDPTTEEETLSTGLLTIAVQGQKLCSVYKPGGSPLSEDQLQDCISKARKRAEQINQLVETALNPPER